MPARSSAPLANINPTPAPKLGASTLSFKATYRQTLSRKFDLNSFYWKSIKSLSLTRHTAMAVPKARVLIVGMGGVGTMAAYALEAGSLAAVTAVLRSNYGIVEEKGFNIDSIDWGHEIKGWRPSSSKVQSRPCMVGNTQDDSQSARQFQMSKTKTLSPSTSLSSLRRPYLRHRPVWLKLSARQ